MENNTLSKYYSRVYKEAFIKSALYGMLVGFGALVIASVLFWIFGWSHSWICAIVFVFTSALSAVAFYRLRFRLTVKRVASKIDSVGLEERILTMIELEGDQSFIANRQREDAMNALSSIEPELIPIKVSLSFFLKFTCATIIALICTTVAVLTSVGVMPSLTSMLIKQNPEGDIITFRVQYEIREGEGRILGEAQQNVVAGENALPVAAIASDGWVFVEWSDSYVDAYRLDREITKNTTYYAVFQPADTGLPGEITEEDQPEDSPTIEMGGSQNNNTGDEYGDEVNGKFEEVNQVIDGKTYYGNVYDEAYKDAMDKLNGSEYSEDEKAIGSGYFDSIEKSEQKQPSEQ